MELLNKLETLIRGSLKETSELIIDGVCTSRILLPNYRDKGSCEPKTRYSEQELKQIFLRQLADDKSFYYSVETPTKFVYSFSKSKIPQYKEKHEKGDNFESARFDVSVFQNSSMKELAAHIEFKYGNPDKKEISKDFLKLVKEGGILENNYFVHYTVLNSDRWQNETLPCLIDKYKDAINELNLSDAELKRVIVFLMLIKKSKYKTIRIMKGSLFSLIEQNTNSINWLEN